MSKGREAKTEGSKERQGDPKRREDNRKIEGRGTGLGQASRRDAGRKTKGLYLHPLGHQPPPGIYHLSWE